jgi:hypothetical protein
LLPPAGCQFTPGRLGIRSVHRHRFNRTRCSCPDILDTKTSTSKDVKTVPPIVQATLNKLLKIEPAIKQLTIASVHTDDSTDKVFIYMSEKPIAGQSNQKSPDLSNAFIQTDSRTGQLLMLNLQFKEWASASLPTVSAAKEAAGQFLTQLLPPDQKARLGEPESLGSGSSGYQKDDKTWLRWAHRDVQFPFLINGIPLTGESALHIGVDAAGHIVSFRYTIPAITGLKMANPSTVIPEEEIKNQLITPDSIMLSYAAAQPDRFSVQNGRDNYVDALTGSYTAVQYDTGE